MTLSRELACCGLEFLEFLGDDEEPLRHSMRTEAEVWQ